MREDATSKKAMAEYARDLTADLAAMARASNLPTLAYWLDLSRAEAECILEADAGGDENESPRQALN
jgi:hypothetical protein